MTADSTTAVMSPGVVTDGQVAALSGAEGHADHGRWHATAVLPVIVLGDPYRWVYAQDRTASVGSELSGGTELVSVRREVVAATVLRETGAGSEAELTDQVLGRSGFSRRRQAAQSCTEQGGTAGLLYLIIRPGTSQGYLRAMLHATAQVRSHQGRRGGIEGSRSQQIAQGRAESAAVGALLDAAGLAPSRDRDARPDGSGWDKIPHLAQPGFMAGRDRVRSRASRRGGAL
jgi:hypothetical protein